MGKGKTRKPNEKSLTNLLSTQDSDFVDFIDKCIEWKTDARMTPEMAFSHPFISKAVNELKCLRTGSQGNAAPGASQQPSSSHGGSQATAGSARGGPKTNTQKS